jgi:hydroxymethylglutaryl-CoA synthase
MKKAGTEPKDYTYAVFHQPNGKFPRAVAKQIGFAPEQISPGLITPFIGNTYSAASMIGLAATLDIAKPGDRIFVASFGSGAGGDAFDITVTDNFAKRKNTVPVKSIIENKKYIDYGTYAKHRRKLVL